MTDKESLQELNKYLAVEIDAAGQEIQEMTSKHIHYINQRLMGKLEALKMLRIKVRGLLDSYNE